MSRFVALLLAIAAMFAPAITHADAGDVNAAARGVVRVVIVGSDGERTYPVSHGTGWAVTSTQIVTNAHVVQQAQYDESLRIAVVPSDGGETGLARLVTISSRNDLALLRIVGDLRLPPLTISGAPGGDSGEVSAVGYPKNVDLAQGLGMDDIFKSQPPVKSRGFLSGRRPSRLFDTILHTAPIAAGNSGGPLLDNCGRVLGVNSFGADSDGSDAEFYFAVSTRELLPFLRANGIEPRVSSMPCRSIAELDADERDRLERAQTTARTDLGVRTAETRRLHDRALLEAQASVTKDRENTMALAFLLVLLGMVAGVVAWLGYAERTKTDIHNDGIADSDDEDGDDDGDAAVGNTSTNAEKRMVIAGTISAIAVLAALALWFTRPGLDEIDRRVAAAMIADHGYGGTAAQRGAGPSAGELICTLEPSRSRITGAPDQELQFSWGSGGCVNGRTQYGLASGNWSRIFVPNQEDAVSVNIYDPQTSTFRTERYLLSRSAMAAARAQRGKYSAPACTASDAANKLGELQNTVTAILPASPNERLVYSCTGKPGR